MKPNRRVTLALSAVLVTGLLFLPWDNTVALGIQIQVLDEAGSPAVGVRVEQEWEYFAIGSERHREVSKTDARGYVAFPPRFARISLAQKILNFVRALRPHGADSGPFASIWAYGPDPRTWDVVICAIHNPVPKQMRLKRWDSAIQ
jgi:hypothetical protein